MHFNSSFRLRKAHIQPLGSALATLVAHHLPQLDKVVRLKNDGWPPREAFPDAFISLTIVRLSSHTRSHWHGSDADRVPALSPEHLQSRINKKNRRYRAYISQYPDVSLLLVMDSFRHSSSFDVPQDTREHVYESRFQRTYLLDAFGSSVIELTTRVPGTSLANEMAAGSETAKPYPAAARTHQQGGRAQLMHNVVRFWLLMMVLADLHQPTFNPRGWSEAPRQPAVSKETSLP